MSQALLMSLFWFRIVIGSIGDSPKGRRIHGGRQLGLSRYPAGDPLSPIGFTRLPL